MKKTIGEWLAILFLSALAVVSVYIFLRDPQGYLDSVIDIATNTCWMGYGTPPNCIGF